MEVIKPQPKLPPNSNQRRVVLIAIGLVALLGVIAILVISKLNGDANAQVAQAIARARSSHAWVDSVEDLMPSYRPEENGAPEYLKAFELLSADPDGGVSPKFINPNEDMSTLKFRLASLKPALDACRSASEKPYAVFPHNYNNPTESYQEFVPMRDIVHFLTTVAEIQAGGGQFSTAIENLRTAARIAHHTGQGPTIIGCLVETGADASVLGAVERLATRRPELVKSLQEVVSDLGPPVELSKFFIAESTTKRSLYEHSFDRQAMGLGEDSALDQQAQRILWLSRFPWIRTGWYAHAIDLNRRYVEALELRGNLHQKSIALSNVENSLRPHQNLEDAVVSSTSLSIGGAFQVVTAAMARRVVVSAGLAVLAGGTPPADLPPSLVDPYTGGPLHYSHDGKSFKIYAVGASGVDHGGRRAINGVLPAVADEVFEYPYKPPVIHSNGLKFGPDYNSHTGSGAQMARPFRAAN